jgi:hypothetical protein
MRPTQPDHNSILLQALELPNEQKALLLDEILQSELSTSVENDRPFLEKWTKRLQDWRQGQGIYLIRIRQSNCSSSS